MPLKFGTETLTSVTCARASVTVLKIDGTEVEGWGETPLSVQWVWPSSVSYAERHEAMKDFSERLCLEWAEWEGRGHALELGHGFLFDRLWELLDAYNSEERPGEEPMPWLAGLVCASAFDIALHDAYGQANDVSIYQAYGPEYLNRDLSAFIEPAEDSKVSFAGKTPEDFLISKPGQKLPVWHLVGGLDPLSPDDLKGDEPDDGYPVLLEDWITRDGLNCLKIKLRGDNAKWDYARLAAVGAIANRLDVDWLDYMFINHTYKNDRLKSLGFEFTYPTPYEGLPKTLAWYKKERWLP